MGGNNAPMDEDVYIGRSKLDIGRGQLWGGGSASSSPKLRVLRGGDDRGDCC